MEILQQVVSSQDIRIQQLQETIELFQTQVKSSTALFKVLIGTNPEKAIGSHH